MDFVKITLLLSVLSFLIAFASALSRNYVLHVELMIPSIVLFVHLVAIAYASSLTGDKSGKYIALFSPIILLNTMFISVISVVTIIWLTINLTKSSKKFIRVPILGIMIAYGYLIAWSVRAGNLVPWALELLSYPLAMIVVVSTNSLPRTFGEGPNWALSLLSLSTLWLGWLEPRLYLVSLAPYLLGARYYKLPRYCSKAKEIGGVAGRGLQYYCRAHAYAFLSLILSLPFQGLSFLHSTLLGFVAIHVLARVPTMIVPLLRLKNARRYTEAPFLLSLLSSIVWSYQKELSWALFALALASTAYVSLQLPRKR